MLRELQQFRRRATALAVEGAYGATLAIYTNPLPGVEPDVHVTVRPGVPLRDLVPAEHLPWACRINGIWLRRDYWLQRPAFAGDVIELHLVPQGGDQGSRTVLQVVAMLAAVYFAPYLTGEWGILAGANTTLVQAGLVLGSNLLINALLPVEQPRMRDGTGGGNTYNVALAGNQARPGEPIPVIYGRHKIFPDFAAQPYSIYDNTVEPTGQQYYHALLAVGHGVYTFEAIEIDDTDIDHFQDVEYRILQPGQQPTLVDPRVVTSPEVAGQDMKSGLYIGGFNACGPRQRATAIGIDIIFPRGLGIAQSNGDIDNKTVTWRIEYREVDDFGVAIGAWQVLANESYRAKLSEPIRRSYLYQLPKAMRPQVRVVRTDIRSNKQTHLNDIQWAGLRAHLNLDAPLAPTVTHLEVKIRASEQLSGMSQRRIAAIVRRKLRTWHPVSGWSVPVETRSIAWALADKWTNPVYGDGLPDHRIDLQTLYELDQVWAQRQDRLDIVFDSRVDSDSADQTIAQVGRARVFHRNGMRTLRRDQQDDVPVTAFTARNILPGSMRMSYLLPTEETADGVIVEYFDNRSWDWQEVLCPAPGLEEEDVANPVRMRLPGITGVTHARREGLYHAAANVYRRKFPVWQTELQGMLPSYGAPVIFAPAIPGWGQTGDVVAWDGVSRVMTLSEPLQWREGAVHYLSLLRDDGSVTDAIQVSPGPAAQDVVLPHVLDFDLVLDDASRERPKFVFGPAGEHRIIVKLLAIRPQGRTDEGAPIFELSGVAEDNRVHAADAHLLPGPGEIQDPVDRGEDVEDGGGGPIAIPLVNVANVNVRAFGSPSQKARGTYILRNDGVERIEELPYSDAGSGTVTQRGNRWAYGRPFEPSQCAAFEVRATNLALTGGLGEDQYTYYGNFVGTFGVWLNLGTTRTWYLEHSFVYADYTTQRGAIKFEIRDAATKVVQGTWTVNFYVTDAGYDPGGGGGA